MAIRYKNEGYPSAVGSMFSDQHAPISKMAAIKAFHLNGRPKRQTNNILLNIILVNPNKPIHNNWNGVNESNDAMNLWVPHDYLPCVCN